MRLRVDGKVIHGPCRDTASLPWFRWNGRQARNGRDEVGHLACFQQRASSSGPGRGCCRGTAKDSVSHLPHMLFGMVQIDDVHRPWEVFGDQVPNPGCPVTQDSHLLGLLQSTRPRQMVEQPSKVALGGAASHRAHTVWRGRIHLHPRHKLRAMWTSLRTKHRSGFDLALHVACALHFRFLHRHAAPTHAGQHAIQFDRQPLNPLLRLLPLARLALCLPRLLLQRLDVSVF